MNSRLKVLLDGCDNIVFFGGAGVSTESGIPDFRSRDGLYSQMHKYPPEVMLSHNFFMQHPGEFYDFYYEKIVKPTLAAQSNAAHIALAELEKQGRLKAVITQNIDGLHQRAGSQNVIELHGSIYKNYCMRCGAKSGIEGALEGGVPKCDCGGIIRPDVVLYGETLRAPMIKAARIAIMRAGALIVGGTSLIVYPAAGLVDFYRGNKLILINKAETPLDSRANAVFREGIGGALDALRAM